MTREETKSCIGTIEMLQRLAYNIHGVMDVIDADNCKKIIKALEQEPCEDKRLYIQAWDKVKEDIKGIATFDNLDTVVEVMRIIDKHLQEIESEEKS